MAGSYTAAINGASWDEKMDNETGKAVHSRHTRNSVTITRHWVLQIANTEWDTKVAASHSISDGPESFASLGYCMHSVTVCGLHC